MEVSGVVLRPLPCFSGAGLDTQSSSSRLSFSSSRNCVGLRGDSKNGLRSTTKVSSGFSSLGFSDNGHLQYYVPSKAGMKKEKKKSETATLKKKLKYLKGMSKDLLRFSSMGFGLVAEDGLIREVKGKKISEATEILLSQLQQLKAEEKELKRKRKEEKAKLKAAQMKTVLNVESSSSTSSESSDSEGGEIMNMNSLRSVASIAEPEIQFEIPEALPILDGIEDRKCGEASTSYSSESRVMMAASAEKIEVCMGGKCKKSGAPALLEEFQQRVGIDGAVVGCKCMGKCRDGPNVRIVNQCGGEDVEKKMVDCVGPNPLCIGVGIEDVGVIVSNFFGVERKGMELVVA